MEEEKDIIITPSTIHICPFCNAKAPADLPLRISGSWVQSHLAEYIVCDRIPADGIHDGMKIINLSIMDDYISGEKPFLFYCAACNLVWDTKRSFLAAHAKKIGQHCWDEQGKEEDIMAVI
jgi:hypothetical protein